MGRAESETIRILQQNGEVYQSDLMRATGFSRATISEVLADLQRRRIVRRASVGRSSKISLVAKPRRRPGTLRLGFTRAAEYPFLVQFRRSMREEGVNVEFKVYDNGVSVASDLASLKIDAGIAPVLTLFMFGSLDAPFKIIGPAGSGGSSVLASPKSSSHDAPTGVCTRMSTMELLMRSAVSHHAIPEVKTLTYASSPDEIGAALMSGRADVCSVWEPYATELEGRGAKRLVRYSEISDHVCCALAAGNHLGRAFLTELSRRYVDSLSQFKQDRESSIAPFAALSGLDASIVRRVSGDYSYPLELSADSVVSQLEEAKVTVPAPSSFKDSVFRE